MGLSWSSLPLLRCSWKSSVGSVFDCHHWNTFVASHVCGHILLESIETVFSEGYWEQTFLTWNISFISKLYKSNIEKQILGKISQQNMERLHFIYRKQTIVDRPHEHLRAQDAVIEIIPSLQNATLVLRHKWILLGFNRIYWSTKGALVSLILHPGWHAAASFLTFFVRGFCCSSLRQSYLSNLLNLSLNLAAEQHSGTDRPSLLCIHLRRLKVNLSPDRKILFPFQITPSPILFICFLKSVFLCSFCSVLCLLTDACLCYLQKPSLTAIFLRYVKENQL